MQKISGDAPLSSYKLPQNLIDILFSFLTGKTPPRHMLRVQNERGVHSAL